MRADQGGEQERKPSSFWPFKLLKILISNAPIVIGMVGVVFGFLALQEPEPNLTFETISDANVLDLLRPLQDLSIVFRGQDVQQENLNLRIVTINVVNSGETDILPSHFDEVNEWGLKFSGGEVVEARLIDADSDYLQERIVPQRLGLDTVTFPKVIFEKGAYFAVEVLLLHPKDQPPSVLSVGKIAGIEEITVLTRPLARQQVGYFTEVLQGRPFVQFGRAILYTVGSLGALFAVIWGLVGVAFGLNRLSARRRRKQILRSTAIGQVERSDVRHWLVSLYEKRGLTGLRKLQEIFGEAGNLTLYTPIEGTIGHESDESGTWFGVSRFSDEEFNWMDLEAALDEMKSMGVLDKGDGDNVVFNEDFVAVVDSLVAELAT